jgi:hypothetical protein
MNGKTSGLFRAIAHFTDQHGNPVGGKGWSASLADRDALFDDCLGTADVDTDGQASFLLHVADIMSLDSPGERTPDLYFMLFKDEQEVFRSEVIEDVDFEALHHVSGDPVRITQSFGPFQVTL